MPTKTKTQKTTGDQFARDIGYALSGRGYGRLFELRSLAERRVESAIAKHPEKADLFEDLLRNKLLPGPLLFVDAAIYDLHAEEMVKRVLAGEDLSRPTRAERCAFFCQLSLKSPLKREYVDAYEREMSALFPEKFSFVPRTKNDTKDLDEVIADVDRELSKTLDRNEKRVA